MCVMALNPAKNGIELTFNSKPSEAIRTRMKDLGFRWHRERKIWYAKHTESRLNLARELSGNSTEMENTPAAEEKTEETLSGYAEWQEYLINKAKEKIA